MSLISFGLLLLIGVTLLNVGKVFQWLIWRLLGIKGGGLCLYPFVLFESRLCIALSTEGMVQNILPCQVAVTFFYPTQDKALLRRFRVSLFVQLAAKTAVCLLLFGWAAYGRDKPWFSGLAPLFTFIGVQIRSGEYIGGSFLSKL